MILIYTEDKEGQTTVRILARKIVTSQVKIETHWAAQGNLVTNIRKMAAKINLFIKNNSNVSKVIVCVDTECRQRTEQEIINAGKEVAKQISIPVQYCPVVHSLEGWLASDAKAIEDEFGVKVSFNSDKECKPKNFLEQAFKRAGKKYDYIRHNSRLAGKVDINTIARNNPSFQGFIQTIKDS